MENLEYKIVLDIVLAESQVDNLKQKLSDTGKEVDTVNSKSLDNLGKSAQEATQDVDNLNKALYKSKSLVIVIIFLYSLLSFFSFSFSCFNFLF